MPTLNGTPDNDTLTGTDDADTIDGLAGNDTIDGRLGHDLISGGEGDDTADGNFGNDTVIGDTGNDLLFGYSGFDLLIGDSNADGSSAPGDGNDSLFGSAGNDTMIGNGGDDYLTGQEDSDLLDGGDGNDHLEGGDANDTVLGGAGDDYIVGGRGDNQMTGGDGNDHFGLFEVDGHSTITDFNSGTLQNVHDGNQWNNDFLNLQPYYNMANLALYNSAHGTSYADPLEWMQADQGDDGILNMLDGTGGLPQFSLTLENGGMAVDANELTYDNTNVICFADDALIAVEGGEITAGALSVGDLVRTRDAGLQPIRWIGRRRLAPDELERAPKLRPIRIRAGALGEGLPVCDLVVSPQHRILVRSRIAQKMFGASEVLVAAKQLCQIDGIDVATDLAQVTYLHFICDAHQIVYANGCETESLYTGAEALISVGQAARDEIFALFPELRSAPPPQAARQMCSGRMARRLAVRHLQNGKSLVEPIAP